MNWLVAFLDLQTDLRTQTHTHIYTHTYIYTYFIPVRELPIMKSKPCQTVPWSMKSKTFPNNGISNLPENTWTTFWCVGGLIPITAIQPTHVFFFFSWGSLTSWPPPMKLCPGWGSRFVRSFALVDQASGTGRSSGLAPHAYDGRW